MPTLTLLVGLAVMVSLTPPLFAQSHTQISNHAEPRLVIQQDGASVEEPVLQPIPEERIPATLVETTLDEIGALSALVDSEKDRRGGGRVLLTQMRDSFLPTWKANILDKLSRRDLTEAAPFIEIFDRELTAHFDDLLANRTDAELDAMFFDDTEIRGLPAVYAELGDDFDQAVQQNTAADGTISVTVYAVDAVWDWATTILDCIADASGPGKLVAKLAKAIHDSVHEDATGSTGVTVTEAHTALDVVGDYALVLDQGAVSATGGREVIHEARDSLFPFYTSKLRQELTEQGKDALIPMLDHAVAVADAEFAKLDALSDAELNRLVYSGPAKLLAEAVVQSEAGLHAAIDRDSTQNTGDVGDDLVELVWNTAAEAIECIPKVGDLLKKILGEVHDNAHGETSVPNGDPVVVALDDLAEEILLLEGEPGRGQALVEHVRDNLVETLRSKLIEESLDQGRDEYLPVIEMGVVRQRSNMNGTLADLSTAELDQQLFDDLVDMREWAQAYAPLDPVNAAADLDAKGAWSTVIKLVDCLAEGDAKKIAAALEEIHEFLH